MNKEEHKILRSYDFVEPALHVNDLECKDDRTLIYGYTCDCDTWHLYLKDNHFVWVLYNHKNEILASYIKKEIIIGEDPILPNKRVYPSASDFEFCALLKRYDVHPCFTSFDKEREKKQFYGILLKENKDD